MCLIQSRFKFWMKLYTNHIVTRRVFNNLNKVSFFIASCDEHTLLDKKLSIIIIEFISMSVSFRDRYFPILFSNNVFWSVGTIATIAITSCSQRTRACS